MISFFKKINRKAIKEIKENRRGFSLIEMLVSIAIFSFVMLAVVTVLLSAVNANRKVQGLKTSIDAVSLTLESMVRNIRTGSSYELAGGAGNCPSPGQTGISFFDYSDSAVTYVLNNGTVQIIKNGVTANMTAVEVTIDRLCFYVDGVTNGDNLQPTVLITLGGEVNNLTAAGAKTKTKSRFDIQTLVTQRTIDEN
jgi:prepilin-type N-terminal cleavage/methylation domain-containing protein